MMLASSGALAPRAVCPPAAAQQRACARHPICRMSTPHSSACLRSAVARVSETTAEEAGASPSAEPAAAPPQSDSWELDFCSRPLLDERGKKVWELLISDASRSFVFARYFPNNKINSTELKAALKELLSQPGAVRPSRVLFFRGQMQTIISRALEDLDIKPVPSRRCFTLNDLLEERRTAVYEQDERYSECAGTMFQLDLAPPMEISDALRGEQWAFVQLPLSALLEEAQAVASERCFGALLPNLAALGLPDDAKVPGVAVFSRRAVPLAAWTNGLELACLKADVDRSCLLLESGVRERWKYGAWRRSPQATEEANAWETAKTACKGLHFMAVQNDPEAEQCAGLWVLRDSPPPTV